MNTPEQFILGELYLSALSAEGYTVNLNRNIGTAPGRKAALEAGTLDVYPEYLNVWDSQSAGITRSLKSLRVAYRAGQRYAERIHLRLLSPTPFSDTEGFAVLASYGAAHRIRTIANLRRVQGQLTLGVPLDFSTLPTGLAAVEGAYRLRPHAIAPVNIGLQYVALRQAQVQGAFVFTTDGQLSQHLYRALSDPLHLFGFGNVVPVVSDKALAVEGPAFAATLNRVDALLTTAVMRGLNAEVELGHHQPQLVAIEFLQGNGLLAPTTWPTLTTTTQTTATPTTTTQTTATQTATAVERSAVKRRLSRTRRDHARKA
jgi:osmoprotectant transport system substrate-binding protein